MQTKDPSTTFALNDYEDQCSYKSSTIEQNLDLQAFCGRCSIGWIWPGFQLLTNLNSSPSFYLVGSSNFILIFFNFNILSSVLRIKHGHILIIKT